MELILINIPFLLFSLVLVLLLFLFLVLSLFIRVKLSQDQETPSIDLNHLLLAAEANMLWINASKPQAGQSEILFADLVGIGREVRDWILNLVYSSLIDYRFMPLAHSPRS